MKRVHKEHLEGLEMRGISALRTRAFTIVEVMVAAAIFIVGLGAVYAVCSQCMQTLAFSRNLALVNQVLEEQTERLKAANFSQLLLSSSLQSLVSSNPLVSGSNLSLIGLIGNATETISVSSLLYNGSAATTGTIVVQNVISPNGSSSVTTLISGTGPLTATTVRLDISISWSCAQSGSVSRNISTQISSFF